MIHRTAIVDPSAELAPDVEVGPFTVIGPHVQIDSGCVIGPHMVLEGHTRIGQNNRFLGYSSIGGRPQDKKYAQEPTRLEIGDHNTVFEFCTFNCGTAQDVGVTRLGNHNWMMAYTHLAHDCQVGNHTIFANNAQIAGHVSVGDHVILGAFTAVHQFVQIGAHSMTAMGSILLQDLPPYVIAAGNTAKPHGINVEGLRRRGFSAAAIAELRRAYKTLYREGLGIQEATATIVARAASVPELQPFVGFFERSTRGIVR